MKWNAVIEELYDEVMKQVEENEKKMKFEYKFYEKNRCPSWLEGDYDLHIEGNKMTMTSKDGIKVEARCHPDDDWRLQIGIDVLKDKMNEKKKPREIKVGDYVRLAKYKKLLMPHLIPEWCKSYEVDAKECWTAYDTVSKVDVYSYDLLWPYTYQVTHVGHLNDEVVLAYVYNEYQDYGFIIDVDALKVVD